MLPTQRKCSIGMAAADGADAFEFSPQLPRKRKRRMKKNPPGKVAPENQPAWALQCSPSRLREKPAPWVTEPCSPSSLATGWDRSTILPLFCGQSASPRQGCSLELSSAHPLQLQAAAAHPGPGRGQCALRVPSTAAPACRAAKHLRTGGRTHLPQAQVHVAPGADQVSLSQVSPAATAPSPDFPRSPGQEDHHPEVQVNQH